VGVVPAGGVGVDVAGVTMAVGAGGVWVVVASSFSRAMIVNGLFE